MLLSALFLIVCSICPTLVRSALFPAALPLAVRSPYFQCYADTHAGNNPNNQWPQYWTESRILGWCGFIRIDGSTFQLWGDDASGTHTNLTSFEVTPTRTILSIHANTTNVDFFLSDFTNAKQRAIELDNKIISDTRQISENYADLVTLAARQALAVDITVSKDNQGQWNTSDVMTFMRDAAFPAYLYFNTTWAEYLIEPLLRYQQSSQYTKTYAAPDLGSSYPSAAGNNNPSIFGAIEDSGNMLIMGWAHARFSGDNSSISRYYDLYKKWADYLVSSTLSPNGYTDADGLSSTNMTNLAIKGIIGIKAMSEISQALGRSQDAETYSSTAKSYVDQWEIAAGSTGHLLSTYGPTADSSSWRKLEDTNNQRSAWSSSTRRTPPLVPEPYDPYGSSGSDHPLLPLHPGQQFASIESHPRTGHRPRKGQPSSSSGPTAAVSPSHESSSVNQNGRLTSDSNTSVQLRSEVENLRREVDEMRARGLYEPPPEYT
ncbi:hypothetical protein ARMGADRAFT_1058457 [Armillaria gallica]|uniref:Glutaminase A central domain-containing protein n=1 Tax=Armillaria gallica TaxID=47427 RepID=A0A2H3EJW8_ARMGA|nr:hypothetical protein ARMGADRAFT_1058457 [Armillaria gallica]